MMDLIFNELDLVFLVGGPDADNHIPKMRTYEGMGNHVHIPGGGYDPGEGEDWEFDYLKSILGVFLGCVIGLGLLYALKSIFFFELEAKTLETNYIWMLNGINPILVEKIVSLIIEKEEVLIYFKSNVITFLDLMHHLQWILVENNLINCVEIHYNYISECLIFKIGPVDEELADKLIKELSEYGPIQKFYRKESLYIWLLYR